MKLRFKALAVIMLLAAETTQAEGEIASKSIDELNQQGKGFYHQPVSCWVCHGEKAEGRVGPAFKLEPGKTCFTEIWIAYKTD